MHVEWIKHFFYRCIRNKKMVIFSGIGCLKIFWVKGKKRQGGGVRTGPPPPIYKRIILHFSWNRGARSWQNSITDFSQKTLNISRKIWIFSKSLFWNFANGILNKRQRKSSEERERVTKCASRREIYVMEAFFWLFYL